MSTWLKIMCFWLRKNLIRLSEVARLLQNYFKSWSMRKHVCWAMYLLKGLIIITRISCLFIIPASDISLCRFCHIRTIRSHLLSIFINDMLYCHPECYGQIVGHFFSNYFILKSYAPFCKTKVNDFFSSYINTRHLL